MKFFLYLFPVIVATSAVAQDTSLPSKAHTDTIPPFAFLEASSVFEHFEGMNRPSSVTPPMVAKIEQRLREIESSSTKRKIVPMTAAQLGSPNTNYSVKAQKNAIPIRLGSSSIKKASVSTPKKTISKAKSSSRSSSKSSSKKKSSSSSSSSSKKRYSSSSSRKKYTPKPKKKLFQSWRRSSSSSSRSSSRQVGQRFGGRGRR